MVLLSSTVPLVIFCLLHLPIPDGEVLKSLTVVVDCSSLLRSSVTFCLKLFDALLFGVKEKCDHLAQGVHE